MVMPPDPVVPPPFMAMCECVMVMSGLVSPWFVMGAHGLSWITSCVVSRVAVRTVAHTVEAVRVPVGD